MGLGTGSAFSLSVAVPTTGFHVTQGEPVIGGLHAAAGRCGADAGAAGVDKHRFARLEPGIVEQHVLDGGEGDGGAGGVVRGDILRHADQQPRGDVHQLLREAVEMEAHHTADILAKIVAPLAAGPAMAAGERAIGGHAVARLPARHAPAG